MAIRHHLMPHCPVTKKVCYETEKEAHAEAKFMRKKTKAKLTEYLCNYCRLWHVGHKRPASRRKIRAWTRDPKLLGGDDILQK